jgi:SpoVK/Ycf46/Vps4 family AAA+-type ATPase
MADRPIGRVDASKLARQTEGYSGADLVHLVEVASERALQASLRTGEMRPISQGELDQARAEVPASTRAWFSVAHGAEQQSPTCELRAADRERPATSIPPPS